MRSPVNKGTPRTGRATERPPMRLDDLAERLGPRVEDIRGDLGDVGDLAVVLAHDDHGGDDFVLVATKAGMFVSYLWPVDQHPGSAAGVCGWTGWTRVRVSPVRMDTRVAGGQRDPEQASHSCTVVVGDATFIASADGTDGRQAVDAFHDEVVRRGTPWHYPA